jgi:hypothetical protein
METKETLHSIGGRWFNKAIMENSMEFQKKVKVEWTCDPTTLIRYTYLKNKSVQKKRYLHTHVYYSTIHNSLFIYLHIYV